MVPAVQGKLLHRPRAILTNWQKQLQRFGAASAENVPRRLELQRTSVSHCRGARSALNLVLALTPNTGNLDHRPGIASYPCRRVKARGRAKGRRERKLEPWATSSSALISDHGQGKCGFYSISSTSYPLGPKSGGTAICGHNKQQISRVASLISRATPPSPLSWWPLSLVSLPCAPSTPSPIVSASVDTTAGFSRAHPRTKILRTTYFSALLGDGDSLSLPLLLRSAVGISINRRCGESTMTHHAVTSPFCCL